MSMFRKSFVAICAAVLAGAMSFVANAASTRTANQLYWGIVYSPSETLYPAVTNICSYPEMATSCQYDDGDKANGQEVFNRENRTWVYWGEMYLEAGTYRVASTFDDYVYEGRWGACCGCTFMEIGRI